MIDEERDGWVTPEEVAKVMLALVERSEISEVDGMPTDGNQTIGIAGGTILEVSKEIREVAIFNDPGPGGRVGNTVTDVKLVEQEALSQLSKKNWGKSKL